MFANTLIENPTFDSQTKENMTLRKQSFGSTCELTPQFIKNVSISFKIFPNNHIKGVFMISSIFAQAFLALSHVDKLSKFSNCQNTIVCFSSFYLLLFLDYTFYIFQKDIPNRQKDIKVLPKWTP